jgi:hypothetical protein
MTTIAALLAERFKQEGILVLVLGAALWWFDKKCDKLELNLQNCNSTFIEYITKEQEKTRLILEKNTETLERNGKYKHK